ncbi:DUF421 domain-containing protein [Vagococcus carniphilus]|uniref:DUF421 domain-containing protein n=1 Tax=Vagococcus carniphilus TaxID=218144 RepID=UPI0028920842|nr:DUF421 domain-containing protein [Vagococcus carniphilus]MDT2813540.1 DUF421 domain-containing protein [Vagococcus carniphilus]MDT2829957.1 DUF421 domain-containing protein [Vagococcus carniphilus]MDT2838392.1 DUF421 domain-containing protein [Vagococcus carniphilus]MDT2850141.1 DUF421 domain-containing protein [Vagococcus carniphilus]MDT2854388.1 DUF421 domain-containing protein [Vagococcus carniphilus]
MKEYLEIGIKLSIGLISLIFQMNLLGKSNLAPTSSLDQLQNFVLGGIIGGMIYNSQISVLQFFLVLIIWTFLVTLIKYLKENVGFVKKLIDGQPVTLIRNGEVLVENCAKKGISASDLMFKLRASNVYDTRQVKRAIQEQNGQLTIILYGEELVRYPLITNGFVDEDMLETFEKDREWLDKELEKKNTELSNVYLGEYNNGNLYLSLYNQPK